MLNLDQYMDIKLLHRQGNSIRAIARITGYSRNTVRKALAAKKPPSFAAPKRASKLDPFKDYLAARVADCGLSSVRLLEEVRAMGYEGGYTILKDHVRSLRPRRLGAVTVRFETPPGDQSQCDWGYCGRFADRSGVARSVYVFVLVLCYSRFMYARFTTSMRLRSLIDCHQRAFQRCGGWTRSILYDNMKQVRLGPGMWNPQFADFADHYGFAPKTHRPYRPRTKGKVERMVGYVKDGFLNGRDFEDFEDLNAQCARWLDQTANARVHATTGRRPCDLLEDERLTPCGSVAAYALVEREPRVANSEGFVLYRKSHYSVPTVAAGQRVVVEDRAGRVAILLGDAVIAEHDRCDSPGGRIESKIHSQERWDAVRRDAASSPPPSPKWRIGGGELIQQRSLQVYEEVVP